ncbi:hypothetical protein PINS_up011551 [Pythium insidiosum]|nr:hypothetical protein PINS_up011551 [Pythium insidiosum]
MVKWKELMQLLALQHGSSNAARKQSSDATSPLVATSPGRNKRKESMIAPSPKRRHNSDDDDNDNAGSGLQPSPSAAKSSNFFGDRTSFWIVQTLSDQLARAAQRGPGGMDVLVLQHTRHALALLVAMLHHQFCVVVRKTRDPKLAKTQYRLEAPASASAGAPRLSAAKSLELLTLLEQVMRLVLAATATAAAGEESAATTASDADDWRGESVLALWQHLSPTFGADYRALLADVRLSLATAALLLTRHVVSLCGSTSPHSLATELVQRAIVVQVKWVEHAMTSMQQSEEKDSDDDKSNRLFSVSWSLFQELLGEFTSVTSSAKRKDTALQSLDPIVTLRPFTILLQHERHGFATLMAFVVRRFRAYSKALETSTAASLSSSASSSLAEACNILRGLQSLVWNPTTSELCRSVLAPQDDSPSRFSLLRFFAKTLVPLLSEILDRELRVTAAFLDSPPLRGYCVSSTSSATATACPTTATTTSTTDDAATLCRSPAHEAWCLVLEIAAGLTRSSGSVPVFAGPNFDAVWEFLASAERMLALSLSPTTRFTRAFVDEQRSALSFLHALSAGNKSARRKQWREMFPRSFVVLMEQSRQVLRRACVLLGNSSFSASRKREQQQQLQKKSRRLSVTAWPLHSPRVSMTTTSTATSPSAASSPSSSSAAAAAAGVSFAQQTLLHEHLQPATTDDRKQLVAFYRDMERALVGVVQQASALLLPWTASVVARDAAVAVDGTRMIDDERLIPLLSLEAPDDTLTMGSDPSVGQLCAAMDYFVDQLQRGRERATPQSQREQPVLANALNACGLLFLKTFLLHATLLEDAPAAKTAVMTELRSYFEQLNDQLSLLEPSQAHGVAHEMFRQIQETIATQC